jgi:hypothetical protein
MLSFGWRTMFMIMGAAGLAMAAIWYLAYRNPTRRRAHGGGDPLSHRGRSGRSADQGELQGMAAIVRLPDHVGDDPRLFRLAST